MNPGKPGAPIQSPFGSKQPPDRKRSQLERRGTKTADPRATQRCDCSRIARWPKDFEPNDLNSGRLDRVSYRELRAARRQTSSGVTTPAAADQPKGIIGALRFSTSLSGRVLHLKNRRHRFLYAFRIPAQIAFRPIALTLNALR